jgi:hypothetical protein
MSTRCSEGSQTALKCPVLISSTLASVCCSVFLDLHECEALTTARRDIGWACGSRETGLCPG